MSLLGSIDSFLRAGLETILNTGSSIKSESVDSTCLSHVAYDEDTQTLFVTFEKSGSQYKYFGVELEVYEDVVTAGSVGRAYIDEVKLAGYNYQRIS